ncbi:DUF2065 domain-containing protein [Marinomonas mediterranea]|jgi:Uncharacterized protein conserved in bacteria (DUF2065).|uniref:DUF2065 domain-containing protein n=1 Tax=Marinomonas mediterranea (strain ATCC 700492 / JCM 21426 / NBRC 103028 / MMB-1) TaxID=717774 RepID=F2JWL2_MARM1|nr:DUF2065 domain-containing protein [Marinomonas mediterranea]ADZ91776.1 Protein of unknown function DUF2065 [Marinomonas mediterranea MMB-1]WCN09732.1 DUF2065 family protein [Marinomonas mediterranea]WCN13813.1 DUF2065 family protein [Marinomonas mediterranea]WCN17869.1 DUF2065 family protein [Marinomonas mediterranea MMB-1]
MQELLQSLLVGISLLLIAEGILPFIAPNIWREIMVRAVASSDMNLRIIGAVSMFLGLMLLLLTRS